MYFAKKKQAEPPTQETLNTAEPLIAAAEPIPAAETLATEPIEQAPPIKPRRIKENRVSDLFDYREEDEARADPLHIEEVTGKCINCRALATYSVNAQTEHCRRCNTEIQPKTDSDVDKLQQRLRDLLLSDKVEKVDDEIDEDDYFNYEQEQVPNQQEEQDNNEHIYGSIDDQQEEQNNNEHIYDSVDDQSDDEDQQGRPIFFRNYYDPIDVIDNQVQPYIPQHFFENEMALTQQAVDAWQLAVNRQATILESGLGLLNA